MVDMFFYRDPEEVEKQQQDDAQNKAIAAEQQDASAAQDWDVTSAPQAGNIDPNVLSTGAYLETSKELIFNEIYVLYI